MKDFDLESDLKNLRVPERAGDYWEEFPDRVLKKLDPLPSQRLESPPLIPALLWGGQWVLACLMLVFCLWESRMPRTLSRLLSKDEKNLCLSVQRFDNKLDRFMKDEYGLDSLIADQP